MDILKKADNHVAQLSARFSRVNKQLHTIGLVISIMMIIATLVFLCTALYMIYVVNNDLSDGMVDNVTLDRINQIVASILLMIITALTTMVFFRLYRGDSSFSRSNISAIRMVAILLVLLSFLPITIQVIMGFFLNIRVGLSINVVYVFIGVVFYSLSYIMEQAELMKQKSEEMISIQESIIMVYAEASENKSGQASQHVKRMSEYSRILAENMDMSEEEVETIRLAAIMHDIGKILIPAEILKRESSLNDEEFAIMKTHVVAGEELLSQANGEIMEAARGMALDHHEYWDGTGYFGKEGAEIDQGARIITLADMFDSLVSARSYKKGWEMNRVYSTITDESGKKLDPAVVDAFATGYKEMMEVYDNYNITGSGEYEPPKKIIEEYDQILGEYSPRLHTEEQDADNSYQNQSVELDLRRLI